MKIKNKPVARKKDIVVQETKNEMLIYDLNENRAYCLNETSALVWKLCDGERTALKIRDEMSKRLNTLISEEIVYLAIDQLNRDGLLCEAIEKTYTDFSRREIIQKAAFASAVALPMIASLAAPKAVAAQSCSALLTSCTMGSECCSTNCVTTPNAGTCCVMGSASNRLATQTNTCLPSGSTQAACDLVSGTGCCSGVGTIATTLGTDGCSPTTVACICD